MRILGISCFFHDSAACLIVDGKIVAAAAEERFSRKKHDNTFPFKAIRYCLNEAGMAVGEIDRLVFYEKPIWKFERILHQHLEYFPKSYQTFVDTTSSWINQKINIKKILKEDLLYYGPVYFVPHHLSHAASGYYLSGFNQAAIVTIDGVGEWATTTMGVAKKKKIDIKKEIRFPHSLGLLYSTLTAYLGFRVNNDEYKVMGLAAYGDPKPFTKHFDELVKTRVDGSFSLNMKYFDYGWAQHMPSKAMIELFGHEVRRKESKIYQYHKNIAAALQRKLEEVILNLLNQAHHEYQLDNLVFAGGVALNSVLNGKIISKTPFKKIYIPPDPSDAGGAMGAALHVSQQEDPNFDHIKISKKFTPYLGPGFSWYQIEKTLKKHNLNYKLYRDKKKLMDKASNLLIKKKVIGWFQGRMEWGPRALGNRSILAAATSSDMQDVLNAKVKHREMFRPFAPVILKKYVKDYFAADSPLPEPTKYMLFVYPFTQQGTENIPSVVHIDGSGRLQSLTKSENNDYYNLIDNYYQKTGIPVIINTSFNVRGEPIVCTPQDAVNCFLGTEIDALIIDQYLVIKN